MSAQNHLAIENVINAVVKLRDSHQDACRLLEKKGIAIAKVCRKDANARKKSYTSVDSTPKALSNFFSRHDSCVVGATVWAVQKMPTDVKFDLVILDEASQLALPEATIAVLRISARPGSRVILAGDHKQLSPITSVDYGQLSLEHGYAQQASNPVQLVVP